MLTARVCAYQSEKGKPCRMPPLKEGQFCWVHSPERIKEVQEARRLGGLRRKRESTVANAYHFDSLSTVEGIRRLVEVAVIDTLSMENSISRNRTLAYLVQVALHTLEVGALEERICALEQLANVKK